MQAVSVMPIVCEQIKSHFSVTLDNEADHFTRYLFQKVLRFGLKVP